MFTYHLSEHNGIKTKLNNLQSQDRGRSVWTAETA